MRKSTMIELVEELEKLPLTHDLQIMIQEAKTGEYHDYKNKKYDCGKIAAVFKLQDLGHHALAERIKKGEFDEEADAEDRARMRKNIEDNSRSSVEAAALKKALNL